MELIDQVLWEQELTEHLKQSGGAPEQFSRAARTEAPTEPAVAEPALAEPALIEPDPTEPNPVEPVIQRAPVVTDDAAAPSPFPSFALIMLWVVVLMVVSGTGWAIGWFLF